jgi:hypothetical protein
MTIETKEVKADDFLTFTPGTPAHVQIESTLIEIGGGAKRGIEYKQLALEAAGWKYKELTSYGAHAETAAVAFNNIRRVLTETQEMDEILSSLKSTGAK